MQRKFTFPKSVRGCRKGLLMRYQGKAG
jgi:predicted transcriptional regulator with HTH domain